MSTVFALLKDAMGSSKSLTITADALKTIQLNYEDEKPETVSNDPLAKSEKSETTSYEGMGDK
ncbi:hypothetical protein RvY_02373 [Ramazzottius varieornatus]|uniref:Uncharacterized protein n=1 Tax=Ramazzottius varieornatus TaxID=947166 RepID=A0A1D1UJG8_RAMVA|nr:hypothetical protein RvY_02373 [Ramazzottius varieornatus]